MDKFELYIKKILKRKKLTILCGDWNIAHKEIDIRNWKANQKNSGFLPEERASLEKIFYKHGLIDAFREVNKEPDNYTWWSNRGNAWNNNVGWRIDYQMISNSLLSKLKRSQILSSAVHSDHCPVLLEIED